MKEIEPVAENTMFMSLRVLKTLCVYIVVGNLGAENLGAENTVFLSVRC